MSLSNKFKGEGEKVMKLMEKNYGERVKESPKPANSVRNFIKETIKKVITKKKK